jgi:hypothetical protein
MGLTNEIDPLATSARYTRLGAKAKEGGESMVPESLAAEIAATVGKQMEQYLADNPEIAETLELFRVTSDQYQAALSAQQNLKTIVAEHSLLPNERC